MRCCFHDRLHLRLAFVLLDRHHSRLARWPAMEPGGLFLLSAPSPFSPSHILCGTTFGIRKASPSSSYPPLIKSLSHRRSRSHRLRCSRSPSRSPARQPTPRQLSAPGHYKVRVGKKDNSRAPARPQGGRRILWHRAQPVCAGVSSSSVHLPRSRAPQNASVSRRRLS